MTIRLELFCNNCKKTFKLRIKLWVNEPDDFVWVIMFCTEKKARTYSIFILLAGCDLCVDYPVVHLDSVGVIGSL